MSKYQNIEYTKARNIEKKENTSFRGGYYGKYSKEGSSIVKEKNNASTSYRIKSRQLSNIYIPDNTDIIKQNLRIYSPKLDKMYKNINNNYKNKISLVYSTFLEYGIKAFAKVLEFNDYKLYNKDEEYNKEFKYYAIFSGDQSSEEKADILNRLNLEENKYGDLISILLISKSGTEGLDLKNVRSIHIMEPYWNFSLIQQIIARGVRYKSHINLLEEERNVQTYIYLSDYNKEMLENEKSKIKDRTTRNINSKKIKDKIELTTDINIFKNAIKNQELIYKFLKVIA
jgi:superfamily II DNA or RNA helicase